MTQTEPTQTDAPSFVPWGLWATIGWTLLVGLVFILVQTAVGMVYLGYQYPEASRQELDALLGTLGKDGQAVAIMTIVGGLAGVAVISLLVRLRRVKLVEYLALRPVQLGWLGLWLAALIVYSMAFNYLSHLMGRDAVTEFVRDIYATSGPMPVFVVGIVVAAPVFEEIFFRGFVFTGLAHSRLGVVGAVVLTALVWTIIHTQYDWFILVQIFGLGLMFGYARHQCRSLWPPLVMHMLMNAMGILDVSS